MKQIPVMEKGEVLENIRIAPGHFRMTLRLPLSMAIPQPGQFVMIRDPAQPEPLLPRPLSVYGFQRASDGSVLELLYRVSGRGTGQFSRIGSGSVLSVLGPLGRGFDIGQCRQLVILAGGVGIAPMAHLLDGLRNASGNGIAVTAYLGARTSELLVGRERFTGRCALRLATDDGSEGYRGLVTDLLKRDLGGFNAAQTTVCACGPSPMIVSLAGLVRDLPLRCEVSLEERMACGIGACLGCAVAVRKKDGERTYERVCHEGPVFNLRELVMGDAREEKDRGDGKG